MTYIKNISKKYITTSVWALCGNIEKFSDNGELIEALNRAEEDDEIYIKINSPGGSVAVGHMLIQAIKESNAYVICDVVYPSASMAACIALAGDELVMQENTCLMFHIWNSGMEGKYNEMHSYIKYEGENICNMFKKMYTPFLTEEEFKQIKNGYEIYISYDDPTLEKRIKRHFNKDGGSIK